MQRNYAIDYFKFFAIFFVVCIHTNPFSGAIVLGVDGKEIDFFIDTFSRFGVPFFFVVSGFLFSQKLLTSKDPKVYFSKYLTKTAKLFMCWYLFYALYGLALSFIRSYICGLDVKTEVWNYLYSFFNIKAINFIFYGAGGTASYHLWYLVALIWSIIVVYLFIRKNRLKTLFYISLLLNIVGLLGQTYSGLIDLSIFNLIRTRDFLFFGLFYTTLGCCFAFNYDWIKQKVQKIKSYTLVLLFFVFSLTQICERAFATFYWEEEIRAIDYYFSTIFLTVVLFLFVIKNSHIGKNSVLSKIGSGAVGIYVSHPFIISLTNFIFDSLGIPIRQYALFHLLFTPLVFIISYVFYNALQLAKEKIKLLNIHQKFVSEPIDSPIILPYKR